MPGVAPLPAQSSPQVLGHRALTAMRLVSSASTAPRVDRLQQAPEGWQQRKAGPRRGVVRFESRVGTGQALSPDREPLHGFLHVERVPRATRKERKADFSLFPFGQHPGSNSGVKRTLEGNQAPLQVVIMLRNPLLLLPGQSGQFGEPSPVE